MVRELKIVFCYVCHELRFRDPQFSEIWRERCTLYFSSYIRLKHPFQYFKKNVVSGLGFTAIVASYNF